MHICIKAKLACEIREETEMMNGKLITYKNDHENNELTSSTMSNICGLDVLACAT